MQPLATTYQNCVPVTLYLALLEARMAVLKDMAELMNEQLGDVRKDRDA
jgi:hypothetical protein